MPRPVPAAQFVGGEDLAVSVGTDAVAGVLAPDAGPKV